VVFVVIFKCTTETNGGLIFFKIDHFGQGHLTKILLPNLNFKSIDGELIISNSNFMNILKSYLVTALLAYTCSCGQAQPKSCNREAANTVLKFYSKYFHLWENTRISNTVPANVFFEKLDSLMQEYCTLNIRKEAKQAFENIGADVLTNNLGSVILNEKLKVEKDSTKGNQYLVSFVATYSDAPGGSIKKQVILNVTVVKEGESYKIDSIK
jgi:hypothetical protein